jgi:nucleoid DNA-binding protein
VSNNKLKKEDIINHLSNKTGFSINFSKKLINDLVKIIIDNIKDDNFNLKNIGSFKLLKKNERLGRNPKTGDEYIIYKRRSVSFKPSKKISKYLNNLL